MPSEEPTVNSADMVSKSKLLAGSFGSRSIRIMANARNDIREIVTTAFALLIEPIAIVRLNAVTLSLPRTIALRFMRTAARVLTFMPPAVDWEAPPTHMRKSTKIKVTLRNPAGLTDTNPELRGVVELNIDCATLSYVLSPASELFCSRAKNTTMLMNRIMLVVYSAILVLRL